MDNLNAYRHVVGPEVRLRVKALCGDKSEEQMAEADKVIQAKRDELDRADLNVIKDFYAEAKRTVYRAIKAGLITPPTKEAAASTMSLPTL